MEVFVQKLLKAMVARLLLYCSLEMTPNENDIKLSKTVFVFND